MHISFYSQYAVDVPEEWRDRACGIAALKMGLDACGASAPALAELIQEGVRVGAWQELEGYWKHAGLAILAHNYGVPAYSEEFRSADSAKETQLRAYGIQKMQTQLAKGSMVLVSVPKDMYAGGHFHLVLLTGNTEGGFIYNDPAYESAEVGAERVVPLETFTELWRGLAIFLG